MTKKRTLVEFINDANEKHNNKFDYSKVNYINIDTNIIIICPIHGEFTQTPNNHLYSKYGCKLCGQESTHDKLRSTLIEFINKANKKYNNKFDYSKVNYINVDTPIIIICPIHGEFTQTPYNHLITKHGCKFCGQESTHDKLRSTSEEIITKAKEVHGDLYDYSEINYINYNTDINIKCKIHGFFKQTPINHIRDKQNCPTCSGHYMNTEIFIEKSNKIHNHKYKYDKVNYIDVILPVIITCKEHGDFKQSPKNHLSGSGCKKCYCNHSKGQLEWLNYLKNILNVSIENTVNFGEHKITNSSYHADGYINKYKLILEYHGCFWHGCKKCYLSGINTKCQKSYQELYDQTQKKKEHCIKEGYKYIEIWECEWTKIKDSNELLENYIDELIKNNDYLKLNNELDA
jgi:G:T-mismatch repair DNA endonuclease (very short patch repair protein)